MPDGESRKFFLEGVDFSEASTALGVICPSGKSPVPQQNDRRRELIDREAVSLQQFPKHPALGRCKSGEGLALRAQWPAEYFGRFLHAAGKRMLVKKSEYRFNVIEEFPGFLPSLLPDADLRQAPGKILAMAVQTPAAPIR